MAQQTQQAAKSTRKGSPGARGATPAPTEQRGPWWNVSRWLAPRSNATAGTTAGAQGTTRPKVGLGKLLVGMLVFIVAAQGFEYLLLFANVKLNLNLQRPIASPNTPLLGGLSAFMLIYLVAIFAIYLLLLRFNILPSGRTLRANERERQTTETRAPGAARMNRHANRQNATGTAKPKSQAPVVESFAERTADDINYERVRAAQRQRKRREARR